MDIEPLHITHIMERVAGKLAVGEAYHTLVSLEKKGKFISVRDLLIY